MGQPNCNCPDYCGKAVPCKIQCGGDQTACFNSCMQGVPHEAGSGWPCASHCRLRGGLQELKVDQSEGRPTVLPIGKAEWIRHQNNMYMFMIDISREIDTTRQDAAYICKSSGGSLISINSKEELEYIQGRIQEIVEGQGQRFALEQWWTSGYPNEEKWNWDDPGGEELVHLPVSKSNHDSRNNVFLGLVHDHDGWKLKPLPANYRLRYICERDAVPEILLSRPPEERVLGSLFREYDRDARGIRSVEGTTTVHVGLLLQRIHQLNEVDMVLTSSGSILLEWIDERLTWIPGQYENVTHILISASRLWLPPLLICNRVRGEPLVRPSGRAVVTYEGHVKLEMAGFFETSCGVDIYRYPFDTQTCSIHVGSNLLHTRAVNLSVSTTFRFSLDNTHMSGQWRVLRSQTRREQEHTHLTGTHAVHVVFYMTLQRNCAYYVISFVAPSVLTSFLMLLVFLIPPGKGERITAAFVIFISYTMFAIAIATDIPQTGSSTPILATHLMLTFVVLAVSMLVSMLCFRLHGHSINTPIPHCFARFLRHRKPRQYIIPQSKTLQLAALTAQKQLFDDYVKEENQINNCGPSEHTRLHDDKLDYHKENNALNREEEKRQFITKTLESAAILESRLVDNDWGYLATKINDVSLVFIAIAMIVNYLAVFLTIIYGS